MKYARLIMGMPVTVEIVDAAPSGTNADFAAVFDYFTYIDETFSTYKPQSEMMRINRGELEEKDWSDDMNIILMLAEETKQRTNGFFDIRKPDGSRDPSGIVKGWAIFQASRLLDARGLKNFYIDAGGDIQTRGCKNSENVDGATRGEQWSVGIRNPLTYDPTKKDDIVKTVYLSGEGIATSGTYIRGDHIYNPKAPTTSEKLSTEVASLTIIGPNVYEADRFATAAFAMGPAGIQFIEQLPGFEGYMIDKRGVATMTSGFQKYTRAD